MNENERDLLEQKIVNIMLEVANLKRNEKGLKIELDENSFGKDYCRITAKKQLIIDINYLVEMLVDKGVIVTHAGESWDHHDHTHELEVYFDCP